MSRIAEWDNQKTALGSAPAGAAAEAGQGRGHGMLIAAIRTHKPEILRAKHSNATRVRAAQLGWPIMTPDATAVPGILREAAAIGVWQRFRAFAGRSWAGGRQALV